MGLGPLVSGYTGRLLAALLFVTTSDTLAPSGGKSGGTAPNRPNLLFLAHPFVSNPSSSSHIQPLLSSPSFPPIATSLQSAFITMGGELEATRLDSDEAVKKVRRLLGWQGNTLTMP